MGLMFQPFRKYFDFDGRARRSEYWLFYLLVYAVLIAAEASAAIGESQHVSGLQYSAAALAMIFLAFTVIPSLSVSFRRLHDIDRSAWWLFIAAIPLFGSIALLLFSLKDGTPGRNRFGPDPKGRGQNESPEVLAFS